MAREILMSHDHNIVEVSGATERGGLNIQSEDKSLLKEGKSDNMKSGKLGKEGLEDDDASGLFKLTTCQISVMTQTIVELAYQTLSLSNQQNPHLSVELYYGVRDLFDLYRAVYEENAFNSPVSMTSSHSASASQGGWLTSFHDLPTMAMVFFNDSLYVAYHLHTLSFQYQAGLPAPLNKTGTFADLIPVFRKLAEKYYKIQLQKRIDLLTEMLGDADGLGQTNDDERFNVVQRVLKQVSLAVAQLAKAWKGVLSTGMYLCTIGHVCDHVIKQLISGVLALQDIGEAETHTLHSLLSGFFLAQTSIPVLFVVLDERTREKVQMPIPKYVNSWTKFTKLVEFLEMRLAEIGQRFEKGGLSEFSNEELHGLIMALFSPTLSSCSIVSS